MRSGRSSKCPDSSESSELSGESGIPVSESDRSGVFSVFSMDIESANPSHSSVVSASVRLRI